jgi:hypothetical protein
MEIGLQKYEVLRLRALPPPNHQGASLRMTMGFGRFAPLELRALATIHWSPITIHLASIGNFRRSATLSTFTFALHSIDSPHA